MADEFICDPPQVRSFIGTVKQCIAANRPHFSQILADPDWLPTEFRRTIETGGMGSGIANWLLYRDTEGTLSLTSLVLSPGVATPVHDHLAWGMVGLYAAEQDEEVYEATNPVGPGDHIRAADVRCGEYPGRPVPYGRSGRGPDPQHSKSMGL